MEFDDTITDYSFKVIWYMYRVYQILYILLGQITHL